MTRPSGRVLAPVFGLAFFAHLVLAARGFHERWFEPSQLAQNGVWLASALGVALVGRLALSLFPPGDPGEHELRALSETAATSLALGWLALCFGAVPYALAVLGLGQREDQMAVWLPASVAVVLLLALFLGRWLTLPGAMTPRHAALEEDFGSLRPWLVTAGLGWLAHAACTRAFVGALAWFALGILLERGLARARRAALGRALFLCAFVALGLPSSTGFGELHGLTEELGVAVALGAGTSFLIPWLRRADRRAGLLAAAFLAAPLLVRRDPLSWMGPCVHVLAAHPRQRRFAAISSGIFAVLFAAAGWIQPWQPRGRALLGEELVRGMLERDVWGLAWPLALAACALGALSFPWAATWSPGTIEAPRRECLALAALIGLATVSLTLSYSPWFEPEALLILFPPLALLAGLLLIPPERVRARA